ncbi:MAG: hypothetical protein ACI9UA_004108 [Pseudoalteromonas tetraodonis]|jgi:hypothetical protein
MARSRDSASAVPSRLPARATSNSPCRVSADPVVFLIDYRGDVGGDLEHVAARDLAAVLLEVAHDGGGVVVRVLERCLHREERCGRAHDARTVFQWAVGGAALAALVGVTP